LFSLKYGLGLTAVGVLFLVVAKELNSAREQQVAQLAESVFEVKLKVHESLQLEYEAFYRTDEWKRLRQLVIERDGPFCRHCERRVRLEDDDITVDHIKPRSLFPEAALDPENLQVLCRRHNSAKGGTW